MKRVLVIADDLSGAAEIAGLAARVGLPTRLEREPGRVRGFDGATVLDTDSRLLPPDQAAANVRDFVTNFSRGEFDLVFKKTDSALRGPILAEVEALMDGLGFDSALMVPQNPSRGRTIANGVYRISGVPLHESTFAGDPMHPARSSNVLEVLGRPLTRRTTCLTPPAPPPQGAIAIAEAQTEDHVRHWARACGQDRRSLPAGGADFFQAILQARGMGEKRPFAGGVPGAPRLFVCGTASSERRRLIERAQSAGIGVCGMTSGENGSEQVLLSLQRTDAAVAVVNSEVDRSPGAAQRIEQALAELVARVLARRAVAHLLLEGGATASAVCRRMGWNQLTICGELATGVVQMRAAGGQSLIVKPGSYPWPDAAWK